jgi:hypothetical protein
MGHQTTNLKLDADKIIISIETHKKISLGSNYYKLTTSLVLGISETNVLSPKSAM